MLDRTNFRNLSLLRIGGKVNKHEAQMGFLFFNLFAFTSISYNFLEIPCIRKSRSNLFSKDIKNFILYLQTNIFIKDDL